MISDNARIFLALMRRELKVIYKTFFAAIIDSFILLLLNVVLLGYLFPRMGMPIHLILPLYIGNIVFIIIEKNFATAFSLVFDIKEKGLIFYQIILPLPKRWLFAVYVCKEMIKTALLTLPLFFIGLLLLGAQTQSLHFSWHSLLMYLLVLLFFSTLFLAISFWYTADWLLKNVWPRRLSPIMTTGCLFFPWASVASFSPRVSQLLLCNPITYIGEGLRASLLEGGNFLPLSWCVAVTSVSCFVFIAWLGKAIKKRLDCV